MITDVKIMYYHGINHVYIIISIYLSIHLSIHPPIYLPLSFYIYRSIYIYMIYPRGSQVAGWPPNQRHQLRRGSARAPWASTWPGRLGPAADAEAGKTQSSGSLMGFTLW